MKPSCLEQPLPRGPFALRGPWETDTELRDIYYRDPELFKRQTTVDRYIDDIAYTCGVARADLNVVSLWEDPPPTARLGWGILTHRPDRRCQRSGGGADICVCWW
jgi:hypothetical protein